MPSRPLNFVTLTGIPVAITDLKWPFHASTSGSDWLVLHGRVNLLGGAEEGLHADVAVGMTQTMKDALGSLAEEHAEGLVVNAIRKILDNGQIALVKSGKLQPVHVTSRFYSFVAKKIQFPRQSDDAVRELIKRRVFWLSGKLGQRAPVEIAHPYDCQYVNYSSEQMLELAKQLSGQGLIKLEGDRASASDWLMQEEPAMLAAMQKAVEAGKAATKVTA
ncbi:MAG: hypothetical protein LAO20_12255 [Acidobacteriia bacterium]|nr:hypothetical protein [Terriglobia bacterium]